MTMRPVRTRHQLLRWAAAVLLGAQAASSAWAAPLVYPRAGVSSEAYRTPPERLSVQSAQPLLAHRAQNTVIPTRSSMSARPLIVDPGVRPVDHQQSATVENASSQQNRQTVRSELQRLYAEQGQSMPQMAMPSNRSFQQSRPAPMPRSAMSGGSAAPPVATSREDSQPGLLAGLFDFGRSRSHNTRSGYELSRPPIEPAPFRPPTYRQQPQQSQAQSRQQQQQAQSRQQTARRQAASPAQRPAMALPREKAPAILQQPPAQTARSNGAIELKRVTPQGDLRVDPNGFFPEDAGQQTGTAVVSDDLAEFFPEDGSITRATPAVEQENDSVKSKMKQLLKEGQPANHGESNDGFQMPIEAAEKDHAAQAAPAAVSELVVTDVMAHPVAESSAEPAPFFADNEQAINPQERLNVAVITGQTFDPSGTDTASASHVAEDASASRMQQIAAREGVGLKGFCPVVLRDERRLADGRAAYVSYYRGKAYYLSSIEAQEKFDANPALYAPASSGEDVAMKTLTGEVLEGSLDHSVWYKNRLYLFHSDDNLKTFMAAPAAMAVVE